MHARDFPESELYWVRPACDVRAAPLPPFPNGLERSKGTRAGNQFPVLPQAWPSMLADDLQAKVSEVLSRYGFRGTVTGLPPNFSHPRSARPPRQLHKGGLLSNRLSVIWPSDRSNPASPYSAANEPM